MIFVFVLNCKYQTIKHPNFFVLIWFLFFFHKRFLSYTLSLWIHNEVLKNFEEIYCRRQFWFLRIFTTNLFVLLLSFFLSFCLLCFCFSPRFILFVRASHIQTIIISCGSLHNVSKTTIHFPYIFFFFFFWLGLCLIHFQCRFIECFVFVITELCHFLLLFLYHFFFDYLNHKASAFVKIINGSFATAIRAIGLIWLILFNWNIHFLCSFHFELLKY